MSSPISVSTHLSTFKIVHFIVHFKIFMSSSSSSLSLTVFSAVSSRLRSLRRSRSRQRRAVRPYSKEAGALRMSWKERQLDCFHQALSSNCCPKTWLTDPCVVCIVLCDGENMEVTKACCEWFPEKTIFSVDKNLRKNPCAKYKNCFVYRANAETWSFKQSCHVDEVKGIIVLASKPHLQMDRFWNQLPTDPFIPKLGLFLGCWCNEGKLPLIASAKRSIMTIEQQGNYRINVTIWQEMRG